MNLDFHHRPTLVKSWLATLHGPGLSPVPTSVGPLPPWAPLVRTAAMWHVAYALVSYAGTLVIARSGAANPVAQALQSGGLSTTLVAALSIWWGGVALSTALWWTAVQRHRATAGAVRQRP